MSISILGLHVILVQAKMPALSGSTVACQYFFHGIATIRTYWFKFAVARKTPYPGDEARYTLMGDKVLALGMNLVLEDIKCLDVARFPLFVLRAELMINFEKTMEPVLLAVAWSFEACFQGLFPAKDPWGMELQGARAKKAGRPIQGIMREV